ncbi:MAG: hypothetical protein BIFFINMI_03316 [Phycisphaerae bacterium]|nr:hypothetical protein [Phycisphaerae bacterium]
MAIDRRHPVRPFQPRLIREFLGGRRCVKATRLRGGRSNSNYRVALDDGTSCVVRLFSRPDGAEREAAVRRLAAKVVPVPQELARGTDWAVFEFAPGRPLADCPGCTAAAAKALAWIASVRLPRAGWIGADGAIRPFDFGGGRSFEASMFARRAVRALLGRETIRTLRAILSAEAEQAEGRDDFGVRLVHGDFNPTNILVHRGAVSAVLDWEFSHAGSPWMDIGNLLRHTPAKHRGLIARGLRAGGIDLPADWIRRAELADLGAHLEFLESARSNAFKGRCVRWIKALAARYG